MTYRRGYAIHHVLAAVMVVSAVVVAWGPTFEVAFTNSTRGPGRARARAVANAAWAQARARLEQGKNPALRNASVLGGRASVSMTRAGGLLRLVIDGRARRPGRQQPWIHTQLRIDLRLTGSGNARRVEVLRRVEVGA